MSDFQKFVKVVLDQAHNHPESPNTVAISTFMYPPQLAWLADGPPPTDFVNNKDKIDHLNQRIDQLNVRNEVPEFARFHSYGVRNYSKWVGNRRVKITTHRWEHWRERNPRNMLHLIDSWRVKMVKAINNYMINRT